MSSEPESRRLPPAAVASMTFSEFLVDEWQQWRRRWTKGRLLFFLRQHVPILEWLPSYDLREDFQYDLVAGITVGMMIVPQEISLSTMMGVPPIYGLYTAALVPMIYPLFGTSRVLSVANGAEVSLLVGSAIKKIEKDEERVATGILLSFLSGLILLIMGISRLGILADFFSRPVMGGFVSAGGVLIMLSQCANWLGVKVPNRDLPFLTVLDLMEQSPHINTTSFFLGGVSILILLGMRSLKRRVVREMAELEEELEEEFAIETTRAVSRMQSIGDDSDADDEHERSRQGHRDDDEADKRSPDYDDIELGDLATVPQPSAPANNNSVLSKLRAKVRAQEQQLQRELEQDESDLSPRRRRRPMSVDVADTPKPIIEADRLYHIVIDTLSIAIISYMSSIAMAKRLAIKEGYRIRPNQELIALGLSNLVGSFFQAMPATALKIDGSPQRVSSAEEYASNMYIMLQLLQGQGVNTTSVAQDVFAAIAVLIGSIVLAVVFGHVAILVSNFNANTTSYQRKMESVFAVMSKLQLPAPLRERIHQYYEHLWREYESLDGEVVKFSRELSHTLGLEVVLYKYMDLVMHVPFWRECSPDFQKQLMLHLHVRVYLPDDYVIRRGEVGDEFYMINRGSKR
ncbi:hypothetical protein P43SY_007104 [Pythium insidiosum]|uniref:Cyclic nucleotide-binding domain-containing protein n=1 Tax=Pythium insidiosum TaxID=114742 RepID=A0AAD5LVA8_PYTIN|nr:hypothetical protein P43SY_007104 [Pythium insidiosum]